MKRVAYITWAAGVAGALLLIWYFGYAEVVAAVAACGWGLLWVALYRVFPLAIDALAWGRLFDDRVRPSFISLFWIRWIGESVNSLLPVAQVGGDVIRARMAARNGTPRPAAAATVVVDFSVGILTQIIFCIVGVGLLLTQHGIDDQTAALSMLSAFALLGATTLYLLPKMGVFGIIARLVGQVSENGAIRALAGKVTSLDRAVLALHQRPWEVLNAFVLKLGGWMARTGETYLAMHFLGVPIGVEEAIIIESLISVVRSAAFAVPGAFGVQEGGIVLLGAMLGIPPGTALALALVKRVREVVIGVPAIIGWSLLETRWLKRRAGERLSGSD
ncbi:MAG: flippase-like domain-containing protein [Kiloniellales bacterium]